MSATSQPPRTAPGSLASPVQARRPSRRALSHAFHAEQARLALGVSRSAHFREVHTSVFHIVAGCAVALSAAAVRPQAVGLGASIALDLALGVITLAVLAHHEETVAGASGVHRGIEPGILPVAALLSLCLVLGGDADRVVGVVAVGVAATAIALVPRLDAGRRLGRSGAASSLGRQSLGVVVVAPMLVAAATPSLPPVARLLIAGTGVTAVGLDALHVDTVGSGRALAGAVFAAAMVALAALVPAPASPAPRAAVLLVIWYGARSLAGTIGTGRFSRASGLEYGIFTIVAGLMLRWTTGS